MNARPAERPAAAPRIASREEWTRQRLVLLEREKDLNRQQDDIARERRALPWVRLETDYVFDTARGPRPLAALFEGRGQLMVQHFMLGPGWDAGCPSCSFMADHHDGLIPHLAQRDITLVAVSRAPLDEIERFRLRMGWRFSWVSSHGNSFNRDFGVSFMPEQRVDGKVPYNYRKVAFPHDEAPGISLFTRDAEGNVYHTYSTYGRGVEAMMGAYRLIDLSPKGRDEGHLPYPMAWVRHRDRYEQGPRAACCSAQD
ncbi:DUF899 domain-containing protein [Luteimonas saliphila]|uniref:DUF899 domain-containing protein n=1 Tax=Luteimonas saliphila TaxID=2804919 RepID=UPI00192DDDA6|nr:thioredoxin family protein [Luteimonas saliphila]